MKSEADRFNSQLLLYAAAGAATLFLVAATMAHDYDVGELFYLFAVAPIVTLSLLTVAMICGLRGKPRRALSVLSMLLAFGAVSWISVKSFQECEPRLDGSFGRGNTRPVMAQPSPQTEHAALRFDSPRLSAD
jgi:hypothetical protein